MFNAEDVDIIVAMELAYTKGVVPARALLDTTAPVLVWNAQKISRLGESDGFDVVMLNSGMAGHARADRASCSGPGASSRWSPRGFDDPDGPAQGGQEVDRGRGRPAPPRGRPGRPRRPPLRGHDRPDVRRALAAPGHRPGGLAAGAREGRRPLRRDPPGRRRCDRSPSERAKYTVEMEPELFERSVRLALALESVVKEHGFDAFTAFDQVWLTDPRVGIIPSYGTGRLCEIGIPASPEGDVNMRRRPADPPGAGRPGDDRRELRHRLRQQRGDVLPRRPRQPGPRRRRARSRSSTPSTTRASTASGPASSSPTSPGRSPTWPW